MGSAPLNISQHHHDSIDIMRDFQYGRNGAIEYKWSKYAPERYVQLYYQIVHDHPDPSEVEKTREKIMREFQCLLQNAITLHNENDKDHMYRMLMQSRDRKEGKGLWAISLCLLCVVAEEDYPKFLDIFKRIVGAHEDLLESERLGCWRDYRELQFLLQKDIFMKNYLSEGTRKVASKDIETICINNLVQDVYKMDPSSTLAPSMLGKWFPREKGKFGWLFNQMYKRIVREKEWNGILNVHTKSDLRRLLSKLNKELKTLEVKQCERRWNEIDFESVSHSRIARQVDAFLGKSKTNWSKQTKDLDNVDRRLCKKQLLSHVGSIDHKETMKKTLGEDISKIVQMASQCDESVEPEKATMLNKLWWTQMRNIKDTWEQSHQKEALFYPLIDVSYSMVSDTYMDSRNSSRTRSTAQVYAAIGIGLSLAHISSQPDVVVFGTSATIIHLPRREGGAQKAPSDNEQYSICEIMKVIKSVPGYGTLSDIACAMVKYADVYKLVAEKRRKDMIGTNCVAHDREYLTIISDFQFSPHYRMEEIILKRDRGGGGGGGGAGGERKQRNDREQHIAQAVKDTLPVSRVVTEYLIAINSITTPHIVMWNMSSTSGFPGLSFFEKMVYMSGTNPRDLITALRPMTKPEKKENVPKRVKGVSANNTLSELDGNNIMWHKTPCYYVHRSLHRDRYN